MADVGKVDGGKLGPGPIGPRKKKGHDADYFREMMKSGKVRETDPEEQRKRKSQAEREEEETAELTTGGQPQKEEVKPQAPDTFNIQFGKEAIGAEGAATVGAEEAAPPPPPFFQPPAAPQPYPISEESVSAPQQPSAPHKRKTERKQPVPIQKPGEVEKKGKVEKTEKKHPAPPVQKKKEAAPVKPHEAPTGQEPVPYVPPQRLSEAVPSKLEEKVPEEEVPPPLAKGAWEATEALDKEEGKALKKVVPKKAETPSTPLFQQPPSAPPVPGAPLPAITAPFAHLPAQIADLYERMVGVMTVMTASGISTTTINLDNPKFANSVFFGAQIIISEYSTAPKAFNIQLLGNQQAVNLFTNNAQELVAAFQAGNYNFKVNRIETGYLSASPEVKRKEIRRVKRKRSGEG